MNLFAIAQSGLSAAQTQLNVAATNIANLNTPGYQSSRADLIDLSTGGVAVGGISKDTTPGPIQPDGSVGSNVDLATQAINLTRASILYSANAAVVRVGEKVTGALLDIFDHGRRSRDD